MMQVRWSSLLSGRNVRRDAAPWWVMVNMLTGQRTPERYAFRLGHGQHRAY